MSPPLCGVSMCGPEQAEEVSDAAATVYRVNWATGRACGHGDQAFGGGGGEKKKESGREAEAARPER
ncbi:MAG: hypothetical protein ACKVW3_09775 [Phycisphaerales bacterium]